MSAHRSLPRARFISFSCACTLNPWNLLLTAYLCFFTSKILFLFSKFSPESDGVEMTQLANRYQRFPFSMLQLTPCEPWCFACRVRASVVFADERAHSVLCIVAFHTFNPPCNRQYWSHFAARVLSHATATCTHMASTDICSRCVARVRACVLYVCFLLYVDVRIACVSFLPNVHCWMSRREVDRCCFCITICTRLTCCVAFGLRSSICTE